MTGPAMPLPAVVVSQSVCGFTRRRARPSQMCTRPKAYETPQGDNSDTFVALAGPPTPPATVEMIPAAAEALSAPGAGFKPASARPVARAAAGTSTAAATTMVSRPARPERR